jgi:hypothetical protein
MVAFMKLPAVLISVFVLGVATPGALADAFFVPLDGSNKFVPKPSEFGYKIETSTVNGQVVLEITLNEAAAKSFDSADLILRKHTKTAVEATVGLVRLDGGKKGLLKLTVDPQVFDGGNLDISSAKIEGQPEIRNFAGFRQDIGRYLPKVKAAQGK